MALRAICHYPHPVLTRPAARVDVFDDRLRREIDDLIETMYKGPATIGLAAPQIGISKRIFVSDVSGKDPTKKLRILVNPEVVASSNARVRREGCLSLPDFTGNVRRAEEVTVRGLDANGKKVEISTAGIEAVCFQHEIDHLDGMLFIHRVTNIQTDVFRRKRYQ